MLTAMIKCRLRILLILLTTLSLGAHLQANSEPPPSDPDLNYKNNEPAPSSDLNLRLYRLFDRLGTDYNFSDDAYVMDVVATIEECKDGSRNISAMNIGGWAYDLDSSCADKEYRGIISIEKGKPITPTNHEGSAWSVTVPPANQKRPARSTIICDARSWNCTAAFGPDQKSDTGDQGNDDEY